MDGHAHDPLFGRPNHTPDPGPDHEPELSPEVTAVLQAVNLREVTAAGFLYWAVSTSLSDGISTVAFKVYRDKLLEDAGSPSDPIEVMMIEQLALAHFNIGRLQIKSCGSESPQLQVAYSDAATRLLGEFRRCTLALEDLRAKRAPRREQSAHTDNPKPEPPAQSNGTPSPSKNGKTKPPNTKLKHNGEVPQCLKDRMMPPIPAGPQLATATGRNGKA
jgi:hypothetical protein